MRSLLVLGALALLAGGCGKPEEVRRYRAPKDPTWRMVAAIVPAPGETWFFKVVAPPGRLGACKDEFTAFIRSLKIAETVTWTLPPGWTSEAGAGERRSTIRFGKEDPRLEVSVVRLPGDAGGVLQNVNRWRGQLGLGSIAEAALASESASMDVSGAKVVLVDLVGPRKPTMGPGMGAMGGAEPEAPRPEAPSMAAYRSMFAYQVPDGWTENRQPEGERILEFRAGEGRSAALVTLSIFKGQTGDVAMNVNRWRQQAGLGPLDDEAAEGAARSMTFLGREGFYVEVMGASRGILCVFVMDAKASMFLKMDGSPDVVDRQKSLFHVFLQSLRVDRKNG